MKSLVLLIICIYTSFNAFGQPDKSKILELMEAQQYAQAADYITSFYPGGTSDPEILKRLGYNNLMAGNLPVAEKYYQQLYQLDSTKINVIFNLAGIQNRRGDIEKAVFYYKKVLAIDSLSYPANKQMAYLSEKRRDSIEIFKYFKKANELNSIDPDLAYDYAYNLIAAKNLNMAGFVVETALIVDSLNLLLLSLQMDIFYDLKQYKKSIKTGERLLTLGDSTNHTFLMLGKAYYFDKQYQKAIAILNGLDGETPTYFMAMAYRGLNDLPNSNKYFEETIQRGISPNMSVYYMEKAQNLVNMKKYNTGLKAYKKATEYDLKGIENIIYYHIARIYDVNLKDNKNALIYYKMFIKNHKRYQKKDEKYLFYAILKIKEAVK